MNSKNIIENVPRESESFRDKSASELREMLDRELSKPDKQIDYGLVDRLTTPVLEAEGRKRLAVDVDDELDKFRNRVSKRNRKFFLPKWAVSLSVACAVLFCANCISVSAWSMNIFKALVDFVQGGVLIGFEDEPKNVVELPTSENDPYGFVAKLAEYGIEFETPHYIPDGFVLTTIDTNHNDIEQSVRFIFENNKENFSIGYTKYFNEIPKIGIPSDHCNISETEVNGSTAVVSKEDDQYTIIYQKDKKEFFMFADKVPYEECDKIVDSIR